ncbi:hypothetical protein [Yeosuana marina]|uniref:hypothetical protein n=1 Tax=Yeosuana marina TaxID=1565536 RepID=UPI00141E8374|nr:hypothetical protein [Yeosuana marina]
MKFISKLLTLFLITILIESCSSTRTYTKNKYWSCLGPFETVMDKDKQELIYKILERAVVSKKDIPDYQLLKDKKRIYITTQYTDKFFEESEVSYLGKKDIPRRIAGVKFSLKSPEELQKIADETGLFTFLSLGNIEINQDTAVIGIDHWWQQQTNSKQIQMSGGGYILEYKKVDGKWQFDNVVKKF